MGQALEELGGRGTLKDIAEIIERKHPQVLQQKTWRNSVSGILSSNSAFSTEPAYLPSGKRARYSMWVLNSTKDHAAAPEELSSGTIPMQVEENDTIAATSGEPPCKQPRLNEGGSESDSEIL